MLSIKRLTVLYSSLIILGACLSPSTIYRQTELAESGDSVILDAKQRIITNLPGNSWPPGVPPRYIQPDRIICPEPSPDVASSLSTAITLSLQNVTPEGSRQSADAAYAAAESLAELGQRLATTQLLRDELADLCRSYANGAISTTNYTLRLAQLDEKMVTLLTAEMIAGSFQRNSAAISGRSVLSGGGNSTDLSEEELQRLRDSLQTAEDNLRAAEEDETNHLATSPVQQPIPSDATAAQSNQITEQNRVAAVRWDSTARRLRETVSDRRRTVADARSRLYSSSESRGRNNLFAGATEPFADRSQTFISGQVQAEQLVALQQNYLDRDELGAIVDTCLTRMNEDVLFVTNTSNETEDTRNELESLEGIELRLSRSLEELAARYAVARDQYIRTNLNNQDGLDPNELEQRFQQSTELDEMIFNNQTELAVVRQNMRNLRARLQGQSQDTQDFNAVCRDVMATFSSQLIRAQNSRLELKLKELESHVQQSRFQTSRESIQLCNTLLSEGAVLNELSENQRASILVSCANLASLPQDAILGRLESLEAPNVQLLTTSPTSLDLPRALLAGPTRSTPAVSPPLPGEYEQASETATISATPLNQRTCPSVQCAVIDQFTSIVPITIYEKYTENTLVWYRISENGAAPPRWVLSTFVTIN